MASMCIVDRCLYNLSTIFTPVAEYVLWNTIGYKPPGPSDDSQLVAALEYGLTYTYTQFTEAFVTRTSPPRTLATRLCTSAISTLELLPLFYWTDRSGGTPPTDWVESFGVSETVVASYGTKIAAPIYLLGQNLEALATPTSAGTPTPGASETLTPTNTLIVNTATAMVPKSLGLATGAKAGIGGGVAAFVILAALGAGLVWRRTRSKRAPQKHAPEGYGPVEAPETLKQELHGQSGPRSPQEINAPTFQVRVISTYSFTLISPPMPLLYALSNCELTHPYDIFRPGALKHVVKIASIVSRTSSSMPTLRWPSKYISRDCNDREELKVLEHVCETVVPSFLWAIQVRRKRHVGWRDNALPTHRRVQEERQFPGGERVQEVDAVEFEVQFWPRSEKGEGAAELDDAAEAGERLAEVEQRLGARLAVPVRVEQVADGVAGAEDRVEECRVLEEPFEGCAFQTVEVYGAVKWGESLVGDVVGEGLEKDGFCFGVDVGTREAALPTYRTFAPAPNEHAFGVDN
ncbi:hypothetical protein BU23DRAFT_569414 [Bimuria novae-zelandiae CBS 107.79]|uniref:Uncharacterized protein n=1 Tax=Bimuria novae-zelandiae CBS 107.79 TaxID=1447943 RepID=A0A6A5V5I8_9PLEO|nr:hypothetical protein BU23DRAFT_569414 [Bimuria novae-zelandiae CBS 107.79]